MPDTFPAMSVLPVVYLAAGEGRRLRPLTDAAPKALLDIGGVSLARRALSSLIRLGWGLNNPAFCKMFTCRFIPEATPEHERWFDELQRVSTSPENAARLMERDGDIDVRPLLPLVKTPTLVIHCDRDHAVPPEHGRLLAAGIPGARYVSLPSANHLMLEEEPAWSLFLEELGLFLNW